MRADHRLDKDKRTCRRCGLTKFDASYCPPGFWMTKAEAKAWYAAADKDRAALEQRFLSTTAES